MADWRFLSGWSDQELVAHLAALDGLAPSTPGRFDHMPASEGWEQYGSYAVIAREAPGPPQPDGPFERAWWAVQRYAFSDPAIVTARFDPDTPLAGRRILLELKAMGLAYLVGVVVGAVRRLDGPDETVRGFRYDTLDGHIERGAEWFLLTKDHASGTISFEIAARWRPGDFPNWWSRAGFALLGWRYQRAWHRRAHHRLEGLATDRGLAGLRRRRLGRRAPAVTFTWAGEERRRPRRPKSDALLLGAITGVRSFSGLAAVSSARDHEGRGRRESRLEQLLADPVIAAGLEIAAVGEMASDKLPLIPPRTDPAPLAGRLLIGGLLGALAARRHRRSSRPSALWPAALLGAAAAGLTAVAATRLRLGLAASSGASNLALGLAEDALVLAGRLLWRRRSRG